MLYHIVFRIYLGLFIIPNIVNTFSCEGCKGFFKRTVRKDLQYACRDEKNCLIDKRQRNRCQFCRYMKCLNTGMKREAVQEERQRARERCFDNDGVESTTCSGGEMSPDILLQAELAFEAQLQDIGGEGGGEGMMYQAADRHVYALVDWVKRLPHFIELSPEDQVILLKTGWNELMIAGCAHQSISPMVARNCLVVAPGLVLQAADACQMIGLSQIIFDRVITEIVDKMRDMDIDKTELGCLRAIILFNPDAKGLISSQPIESLRERIYATLEDHCRQRCPDDHGRFAKLLLRLPALRSIGLKCREPIFFSFRLGLETQGLDGFLMDALEYPNLT